MTDTFLALEGKGLNNLPIFLLRPLGVRQKN